MHLRKQNIINMVEEILNLAIAVIAEIEKNDQIIMNNDLMVELNSYRAIFSNLITMKLMADKYDQYMDDNRAIAIRHSLRYYF